MGDSMTFPKTMKEFIDNFSFKDTEEVYTNGAELIPVFRVEQALEHYEKEIRAKDIDELTEYRAIGTIDEFKALKEKNVMKKPIERTDNDGYIEYYCPNCEARLFFDEEQKFCNECGQKLD